MKITLVAFGIAKDILGQREIPYELTGSATVEGLLDQLKNEFPEFQRLTSLRVAVNSEYARNEAIITAQDEVVLIPPVSGG